MKKLNLFLASILALFAGVLFSACDKDSIKVDFAQDEIVRSVDEQIKLDELISVKGISKSSIEYKIAKSSAFEFDAQTTILTAKESGFSSYVYATYHGNILDGMNIVIKTSFSAPDVQTFVFEDGYLKWNKVADYFENSQTPTQANKYLVEGTLTTYNLDNPDQEIGTQNIRQETNENKYSLFQSGLYTITVKALGTGYFADSAKSGTWTKKIGYINAVSNLIWNNNGTLSWQDENTRANYRVKISKGTSNTLLALQQTKTCDVSAYFENATAGAYAISVVSYDRDGVLIANESDSIQITKLETPNVEYVFDATNGGRYKTSPLSNATSINFDFEKGGETTTLSVSPENEDVYSAFDTLNAGEYQTYAYAVGGENTFRSTKVSLGTTLKLQTPNVVGLGENEENGNVLNIKISTAEDQTISAKIVANTQVLPDEIEIGENEVSTTISLSQTGTQTFNFSLKPKTLHQTKNILNSTSSADFVATKLAYISGEISHSQTASTSILTFNPVENATAYQIFIETSTGYVLVPQTDYTLTIGQTATCEFDEKIEDMFDTIEKNSKPVYSFKIVAVADGITSIPSSTAKIIEVLTPPQSLGERQSTQKSIEWEEVSGAESYNVELYALSSAQYQEYQTSGETTLDNPAISNVQTNSLTISNVGYYLARIYSISNDVNVYINSENYLEVAFCVSEKLEFDSVEFGYKEEYVAPTDFESATGYFLKVEKPAHAHQISVSVDESDTGVMKFSENSDYIIYLFGTDFGPVGNKTSYEISAVASAEDSVIYLNTDEKVLTISKLPTPRKKVGQDGDISFSEGPGHGKTSQIVLTATENASAAQIWQRDYKSTTFQTNEESATFDMINLNSANLVFKFKGTEISANGIYQSDDNIFIDSDEVEFSFTRLDSPTNLAYDNGSITFDSTLSISTSYSAAKYFVLEISDGSNPTATPFEIIYDTTTIKLVYNGVEVPLGSSATFVSKSSNTTTIDIRNLIALVKNSPFASYYANIQNVVFKVYAWQAKFNETGNEARLSSNYASTKLDPTSRALQIQRVPTATLSAQTNNDLSTTLSVAGVDVHEDYKNLTSYQLYKNDQTEGAPIVSDGANITWTQENLTPSIGYRYKVVVSNPYYLESKDSNEIVLYRLAPITNVTVGTDGTISYLLGESDAEKYSRVKIVYDNGSAETTSYSTNGKFSITGVGTYKLTVLGGNTENSYIIDSETTTFTVLSMSTLMPNDTSVNFSNNVLTWNAFAQGQSLEEIFEYVVSFDDGENVVSVSTNTNSLNLLAPSLAELASQLSATNLTIQVYARLKTYSSGGQIYYAQTQHLDGTTVYNYFAYTTLSSVAKLSAPNITNVEFVSPTTGVTLSADSITPNINIVFEGNYGAQGTFEIYINGTKNEQAETINRVSNTYTYTISATQYNSTLDSGESLIVEIQAISGTNIPSARGRVEIVRAYDIAQIGFREKTDGSLEKEIVVTFTNEDTLPEKDFSSSIGGVVFEIKYKATADANYTTEYVATSNIGDTITETLSYSLSDLIDSHLSAGGVVSIRAFTNSYSNSANNSYFLSSPQYVSIQETTILKRISNLDITQNSRGFNIDPMINPSATYVVSCGGQTWEVEKEDDKYFFEYPDTWESGTSYTFDIYAKEDGKINSASITTSLTLERMSPISGFTITRDSNDVSLTTISWSAPSVDATSYLFKVFEEANHNDSIYEKTLTGTSFTMSQIFEEDYSDFIGQIDHNRSEFEEDKKFYFQIITLGHDAVANSNAFDFEATIVGNSIQIDKQEEDEIINNIYVDELGFLWFDSKVGQTYIYRLLTAAGEVAQAWKTVTATETKTEIEINKENGRYINVVDGIFNVDVIAIGSATTSGVSNETYGLKFDSIKASTYGANSKFYINDELVDVKISDSKTSLIVEAISNSAFTKIVVGTAIDAVKLGQVIEISIDDEELEELGVAENPTHYLYSFPILSLIDRMRTAGIIQENQNQILYFWSYKYASDADYVISNPKTYELTLDTLSSYEEIMKPGTVFFDANENISYRAEGQQNQNTEQEPEDYNNAFALFTNEDKQDPSTVTIGIYTKITKIIDEEDEEEPFEKTVFLTKSDLLETEYFNDTVLAINITNLFEAEDLIDLTGTFKLKFLKIKTVDGKLTISNWRDTDEHGEEFVFQRITSPTEVKISSGNLAWKNSSSLSEKSYIYFYGANKQDEEYTIDENSINRCVSAREIFDASSQVGDGEAYFIAVQSISKNARILSSKRTFKTHVVDNVTKRQAVIKNQIQQKLSLEDGTIKLGWQEEIDNGMYELLFPQSGEETMLDKRARRFVSNYFKGPFTFKLSDLISDKIVVRFGFTDITSGTDGIRKTVDVNAKYLLTDFVSYIQSIANTKGVIGIDSLQIENNLRDLKDALQDKTAINAFMAFIGKETNGIGNQRKIFDSVFERIQTGKYKIEYCLLGGENTLTSNWYSFENINSENVSCINAEPSMIVKKENLSNTENVYKLMIKKSQIYRYDGSQYTLTDAENYVVKFSQKQSENFYAFAITKPDAEYKMYLSEGYRTNPSGFIYEEDSSRKITVYEANEDGIETSGGNYLMIYLNLNDGDSVLGKFSNYLGKYTFNTEVYAVGNNVSISSKSSLYQITFAGFCVDDNMNLELVDGVFKWNTYQRRDTTVAYKNHLSSTEEKVIVKGGSSKSEFALETGAGQYDTIKFVNVGEIKGNSVVVDSEIYQIKDVYKLSAATLNPKLGTIEIKEANSNADIWTKCYTTSEGLNYKITNDRAQGDYIIITNENGSSQKLYYEVGTTGMSSSDADYEYKESELQATEYQITSLGSNAKLKVDDTKTVSYYLRTLYPTDNVGALIEKSVAVSSRSSVLVAKMLSDISGQKIENGVLTWNAYENESISLNGAETVVYRITIEQFKESYGTIGQSSTGVASTTYIYIKAPVDGLGNPTNPTFDFKDIEIDDDTTSLKATVQVFVAKTSDNIPEADYRKSLLKGGYVYANASFTDDTPALMSNGAVLSGIQRLAPIDENSLRVEDGKLVWNFTADASVTENNFKNKYSFIVEDENNNKVDGDFAVAKLLGGNTFKITFTETKGSIPSGIHTFKVYTSSTAATIKSIPTIIEDVEKLTAVSTDDYEINSYEYSNAGTSFRYEILSLKPYFDNHQDSEIEIHFANTLDAEDLNSFTLTKESDKVYIFRESSQRGLFPGVNSILLISDSTYNMTMDVSKTGDVLFADTSDQFVLSRANWGANTIEWDFTAQQFTWTFDNVKVKPGTQIQGGDSLDGSGLYTISNPNLEGNLCTISDGTNEYTINKQNVINPVFVITASYGTATRTYQTEEKYFKPTIIGAISISIIVKFGKTNVESNPATFNDCTLDLFNSGDGTELNPYIVSNAQHFKNIAHRMIKDSYLNRYISNGAQIEESDENKKYHFSITEDIDLTENDTEYINGIFFKGEFSGVIHGVGSAPTIKYMSKEVSELSESISIPENNSTPPSSTTVAYASSLFETLSSGAQISNLNISAYFGDISTEAKTLISKTSILCSGLAVTNKGVVDSITLTGFTAKLYPQNSYGHIFYAGIVGLNTNNQAKISNCEIQTNMTVSGSLSIYQTTIAVAGIANANSATIENCTAGAEGKYLIAQNLHSWDIVKVAGICTIQTTNGTMTNCISEFVIEVDTANNNDNTVYIAKLADFMAGSRNVDGAESYGELIISEGAAAPAELHKGILFAVED